MSEVKPIKKYPFSTAEVAKMLGIKPSGSDLPLGSFANAAGHPVANLPVVESHDSHASAHADSSHNIEQKDSHASGHTSAIEQHIADIKSGKEKPEAPDPLYVRFGKAIFPYAAIFSIALFLYYFYFTGVNFGAIFNSAPKAETPKQTAMQVLEAQDSAAYQAWIKSYYYEVSDPKMLDPEADNSGNGLSNFQKYLLKLNPKSYDSLGQGVPDSQTIAMGIDPLTGSTMSDSKKDVVSKYVDMEVVSNRLALNKSQHPETVAGVSVTANNNSVTPRVLSNNQTVKKPVMTGADLAPSTSVDINTNIPGRLEIPDLKISAPIMWTSDPKNFNADLQSGVIHYPGTALPGEMGTSYISGHSSNYFWAKGDYNRIFSHLGDLADNTSFKITVVQTNGKNATFHYVVTHRKEYLPTDQEQFQNNGNSTVALSTCWPVNTTARRLVVFGQLTQVEK